MRAEPFNHFRSAEQRLLVHAGRHASIIVQLADSLRTALHQSASNEDALTRSGATRTAMTLDEQDPWSHFALGRAHHGDHRAAQRAFRRAVALNPNFALAHSFLGLTLAACNEADAGIESIERALRLMPGDVFLSFHPTSAMAIALFSAGRYAESVAWARRAIERRPDYFNARRILVAAAAMNGDLPVATEALTELHRLAPDFSLARERRDNNFTGDMSARLLEGLRRAGVPEM
jgi:adenylate cyclase